MLLSSKPMRWQPISVIPDMSSGGGDEFNVTLEPDRFYAITAGGATDLEIQLRTTRTAVVTAINTHSNAGPFMFQPYGDQKFVFVSGNAEAATLSILE
jgi:hypothetical protein